MFKSASVIFAMLVVFVPAGLLVAGQMGLLTGKRPNGLGAKDGLLKAPYSKKTNAVSSQAARHPHTEYHVIAPLAYTGDGKAAFARLQMIVQGMDGATIIEKQPGYLYAEFTTKWMKFVDDVEFLLDEKERVIHMRSASRLGGRDYGTNRNRLEAVRTLFNA